jgi:SAM-dependent methyltransferase
MPKDGELTYFDEIGEEGVAHSLNKPYSETEPGALMAQMAAILTLLPEPPGRILDLGCGTGWTSEMLAKRGYQVVGQDVAANAIELAKKHATDHHVSGIEYLVGDYESLRFKDEFDGAVFFASLHHATDERKALRSVYHALKPGGVCVTLEPGTGHAAAEETKLAADLYNVTEKDMPPKLITKLAKEVGFSHTRVYADAGLVNRALYVQPKSRRSQKLLRNPLMSTIVRGLTGLHRSTLHKRHWGIAYLQK